MISDFRGRRVTVMGLGSFGGGSGVVHFLLAQGAKGTVTDLKPAEQLADSVRELGDPNQLELHLSGHQDRDFHEADLIVASPAVPKESRYLQIARDADVPVTSEMNIFWERNQGRTICVTGSNGKSTTAAMIACLLSATKGRRIWLGGNIGKSLLPSVDQIVPGDWVVLELSSFQLEDLAPIKPDPHIAIVTNFSPNPLDRHVTLAGYRAAKQNILKFQTSERLAILNQNDPDVVGWPTKARKLWFGREDEGRQGMFAVGFEAFKRQ